MKYSTEYFQTDEWEDELSEARRRYNDALSTENVLRLVVESGDVPFAVELELDDAFRETRKRYEYIEALLELPKKWGGTQLIRWMDKWQS